MKLAVRERQPHTSTPTVVRFTLIIPTSGLLKKTTASDRVADPYSFYTDPDPDPTF